MHPIAWLAAASAVLAPLPPRTAAAVDATPAHRTALRSDPGTPPARSAYETAMIALTHIDAQDLLKRLLGRPLPGGEDAAILGFPVDNSIIVRAAEQWIAQFAGALAVVDVPIVDRHLVVTARWGNPAAIAAAATRLPAAGTVAVAGRRLEFRGDTPWLDDVRGLVFSAELEGQRAAESPAGPRNGETAPSVRMTVPAGLKVDVAADHVEYDAASHELRAEGNVAISWPNGPRIEIRQSRVRIVKSGPRGETSVVIEPLPK